MRVRVDDFECKPDGRYLERIEIGADSTELTAVDGTFRQSDVGKHIAIPGAVDLIASLARFPRPNLVVANASMVAGEATLTAEDASFQRQIHKGMRITVEGAGANGGTLLTDVSEVANSSTVVLADKAVEAVANAVARLNLPDRVLLSDYPRARTGQLTVHVRDRELTDGRMTIGHGLLQSATAGFSSLDLGHPVTIRAAGCLVTTIQVVHNDTQVTLASPAQWAVVDGVADVWRTDSRPGFEQLLVALQGADVESAEIEFSPGVYDFTRVSNAPGALPAALGLDGVRNLTLRGGGQGVTILRMMPDQDLSVGDANVIMARDGHRLTLRDLSVHGAYLTMGACGDPMHGIHLDAGCHDIVVERVDVFQSGGDGVRLIGSLSEADRKVRRVSINGCRLVQNHRTGIAFQRAVEFVWVRDCYIEMTPPGRLACIDFEPSANEEFPGVAPADIFLDSNVLVHGTDAEAVSISGVRPEDPVSRVRFTNNTLHGGGIGGIYLKDVTVTGNLIAAGEGGQVARFAGNMDGLRIEQNTIHAVTGSRTGLEILPHQGIRPRGVRIVGNNIETAGIGISIDGPDSDIEVRGNRILGRGEAIGISIKLRKPQPPGEPIVRLHTSVRIIGNTIVNFADAGIELSTEATFERFNGLEVSTNEIYIDAAPAPDGLVGIRFSAPPQDGGTDRWVERAYVTGNRIADAVDVKIERHTPTVPFFATSGNPGGRSTFEGDGSPNEIGVMAPPGSIFLQIDNEAGAALYLKASGHDGSGWIEMAKSTP